MSFENISVNQEDRICTITINRPKKLNALNIDTLKEISQAVNDAIEDDQVGGIIVTGAGDKAFAAGADVAEFSDYNPSEAKEMAENTHHIFRDIENSPKPIIAAINGIALGGGCELAMACHLRIASNNVRLGQPEVGLGLIPGYGGTQKMSRLIGKTKAMEYLLTGDMITAAQAENMGLINYMVDPQSLMQSVNDLLSKILSKSPLAVRKLIECVNAQFDENKDGYKIEIEEFASSFSTEDFKEGVSAFLNKKEPNFKGK